MNIPDSLIRLVKAKTGVQETSVVERYICEVLEESEIIMDMVADFVGVYMTNGEEFINETPREKRERLERIERG